MKKKYITPWIGILVLGSSIPSVGQVNIDYKKYPDYSPVLNVDPALGISQANKSKSLRNVTRPARVNNAETPYFPPVFNQDGGSCGSASRIGYMFNYELNALRGADGSLDVNQYPTHFTWLLTSGHSGKEGMAAANGIPSVPVYGGRTYSRWFGNQDETDIDYGWMQGYDKWYEAMCNRITKNGNFPMSVQNEEGREAVKNWIWNHNGDSDFHAGGIAGIGVASGGDWKAIPSTPKNIEHGVVGKYFVNSWGASVDHALTIVGYDDNIEFDLDGNGIAGEIDKDEVGAWIIVNSWGAGWCNNGFIYCPYKYGSPIKKGEGGYWSPEVYYARKNYRPLRTFKIKMDYSKRSEISISGGISSDINATQPEKSIQFEHFKYAGDGKNTPEAPEVPMLGRWVDGMHSEPMEFGYDLTDLSTSFDTRKPLKYFLIIETKSNASGTGKIYNCSLMDYEFDTKGIELPFDINAEGVTVENQGKKTIISAVITGEPFNAPSNAIATETELMWSAPSLSPYSLKSYKIYQNGSFLTTVDKNIHSYTIGEGSNVYAVSAIYEYNGTEVESSRSESTVEPFYGSTPTTNYTQDFKNCNFTIQNVFAQKYDNATIEFWLKPTTLTDWNQQIGPGWGTFLIHANNNYSLSAGWANGSDSRINTEANSLKLGEWNHIAVVVESNVLTVYINGENQGSTTSGYNGLGGFGNLAFGSGSNNTMNGGMDELRIWSCARTQAQIKAYMHYEIKDPSTTRDLLVDMRMSEATGYALKDQAQNHKIIINAGDRSRVADNNLLIDNTVLKAGISLPEGPYYANTPIDFRDNSSSNAVKWAWSATNSNAENLNVKNPTLTFTKAGEQTIKLIVTDAKGNTDEVVQTITTANIPTPNASFKVSSATIPAGDHISFINTTTPSTGCTYEWNMPGAQIEKVTTTNAAATYDKSGTYNVTLKVTNGSGTKEVTQQVTVTDVAPQAAMKITNHTVVKNNPLYLEDVSKYSPTAWTWVLDNDSYSMVIDGQNTSLRLDRVGTYDVTLTASNAKGKNSVTQKKAITVCNADGKNGLNFSGNEAKVTMNSPLVADATGFTIDWWMYAKSNSDFCNQMGDSESTFMMKTKANGAVTVYVKNKSVTSDANFIIPSEWHHYAVVFNRGSISFYRDAKKIGTSSSTSIASCPQLANFTIGSSDAPMNAVIDEFRVWNRVLTIDMIKEYCNQPIENVADAQTENKLSVYYQFNQNSGNVIDATSNNNIGVRTNFGPDGDAWSSTLGIFAIDFGSTRENVTAKYLTNYSSPFKTTSNIVNPAQSPRFKELEQETSASGWKLDNKAVNGNVTTGFHVDVNKGSYLTLTTSWDGFASSINNHKAYEVVSLPAGSYILSINTDKEFAGTGSYLAIAENAGLPNIDLLENEALAYAPMNDKTVNFVIDNDKEVSLGMVMSMSGQSCLTIKNFTLETKAFEKRKADGVTGIQETEKGPAASTITVNVEKGGVQLVAGTKTPVKITTATGVTVFNNSISGSIRISLPKGIYVINNKTFSIF